MVFADGRTIWGRGFGAEGEAVGELCFNTAMTGYQEVMTDPHYARQIVTFTFPHIGNVGANAEDVEAGDAHALGCIVREAVTAPSNFRADEDFAELDGATGRIGIAGRRHARADPAGPRAKGRRRSRSRITPTGEFDLEALQRMAREWPGLEGMDLAKEVSRDAAGGVERRQVGAGRGLSPRRRRHVDSPHVVAIDYGAKRNIFRNLVEAGRAVTVLPATASFDEVMATSPTASSCPTARATRPRPANMRCR